MNSIFFSILISLSLPVWAQTTENSQQFAPSPSLGVAVGFRQTSVQVDAPAEANSNMGVQAGFLFFSPMNNIIEARVGALYGQRNFTVSTGGTDVAVKLGYLDVPLTVGFSFNPSLTLFGGLLFALNIDKSCSGTPSCKVTGLPGFDTAFTAGGSIKIAETFGIEVIYEKNSGKLGTDINSPSSAGINLIYLTQ